MPDHACSHFSIPALYPPSRPATPDHSCSHFRGLLQIAPVSPDFHDAVLGPFLTECEEICAGNRTNPENSVGKLVLGALLSPHFDPEAADFISGLIRVEDDLPFEEKMCMFALLSLLDTCIRLFSEKTLLQGFVGIEYAEPYVTEAVLQTYMQEGAPFTAREENIPTALLSCMHRLDSRALNGLGSSLMANAHRVCIDSLRFPFNDASAVRRVVHELDSNAVKSMSGMCPILGVLKHSAGFNTIAGGAALSALELDAPFPGDMDVMYTGTGTKQQALDELFDRVIPAVMPILLSMARDRDTAGRAVYEPIILVTRGVVTVQVAVKDPYSAGPGMPPCITKRRLNTRRDTTLKRVVLKVQFLLRAYRSVPEILCSFDLSPAKVAFCAKTDTFHTMATTVYSMAHGVTLPNPMNATSARRALKYQKQKGFVYAVPIGPNLEYLKLQDEVGQVDPSAFGKILSGGRLPAILTLKRITDMSPLPMAPLNRSLEETRRWEVAYEDMGYVAEALLYNRLSCSLAAEKRVMWTLGNVGQPYWLSIQEKYPLFLRFGTDIVSMKQELLDDPTVFDAKPCSRMFTNSVDGSFYDFME